MPVTTIYYRAHKVGADLVGVTETSDPPWRPRPGRQAIVRHYIVVGGKAVRCSQAELDEAMYRARIRRSDRVVATLFRWTVGLLIAATLVVTALEVI